MKNLAIPKFSFLIMILLCLGACQGIDSHSHVACNKDQVDTPFLLSVHEAQDMIEQDSTIIVIEVSKKEEYSKGHLAEAANVWRSDFQINRNDGTRGLRCSADTLQSLLQSLGVNDDSFLILYDAKGSCDASRMAWVLDYYGFEKYAVMNGGKKAWIDHQYEISFAKEVFRPNPDFQLSATENESVLATIAEVRSAMDDPNTIIVDTREDYEHKGSCFFSKGELFHFKKGALMRGCIPTAVHLNWSDLADLEHDHRIKCKKDLLHDLHKKGIAKDKNVIVYCHSGARSSHTYFVLQKVLGFENVKNYDGSWIEWSHMASIDDAYPIDLHVSEEDFQRELTKQASELQRNVDKSTK